MAKVATEVTYKKAEQILKQLDETNKQRLIKKLVSERFEKAVKKFRENIKKQKLSTQEINQIVEDARQEFYEKSRR